MILAAAACGEGHGPPPPELEMAWHADAYGAAAVFGPAGAGLGTLRRMTAAANTYNAMRSFRTATNWAAWAEQNPEFWKIKMEVLRLREIYGE
jgi:hypothetical protein